MGKIKKNAGILLHITSLANKFPIGDLGGAAYKFADFLHKKNYRYWQVLPIGSLGKNNSPYQMSSAFAGNTLLISPEKLLEHGFLSKADMLFQINKINKVNKKSSGEVDYSKARQFKNHILKIAFRNFKKNPAQNHAFHAFVHAESYWLNDYVLYMAIKTKMGTAQWTKWPRDLRLRHANSLAKIKEIAADTILFHQFVQWQFALQWQELQSYCRRKGIRLIGDVPLYVSHLSPDVWAHPDIFKLNKQGMPIVQAGVEPDYFSKTGQLWNVPVYRWDILKEQKYKWWIERLRTTMRRFDLVRLDHFIGFVRTYEVLANAKTAKNGQYVTSGGSDFFNAVNRALGRSPFIADDLGKITIAVEKLRDKLKIPGTRVLQFELENGLKNKFLFKKQYSKNAVLYTSTHDNNTCLGWYRSLSPYDKKILCTKLHTNARGLTRKIIYMALVEKTKIVIIPMQDLLNLGTKARMNFPGRAKENWKWRLRNGT